MSVTVLTRALLALTNAELSSLAANVRKVGLSAITSISALSQSTAFSQASAGEILEAVLEAQRIRAAYLVSAGEEGTPENCGPESAPRAAGYRQRFSPVPVPQGVTWSP